MIQEEKQLLLVDLCGRLAYGVKVTWDGKHPLTVTPHIYCAIASEDNIDNLPKLLLRPMSSMTEEEKEEYCALQDKFLQSSQYPVTDAYEIFDWLNRNMFDYRGLTPMGLALEAPKDMYKEK